MNKIQSKDQNVRSHKINKVSLSLYNDKRYILRDGYSSLSHLDKSTR